MIIYNVTVAVEPSREEEFVNWMKEVHLPEVMETGCFLDHDFFRVLNNLEDANPTYAIQYKLDSLKSMQTYETTHAARLRNHTVSVFGDSVQAFRTILEQVS